MNNFTEEQLEILAKESASTITAIQENRLKTHQAINEVIENLTNNAERIDGIFIIAYGEPGKKLGFKEDGEFKPVDVAIQVTAVNGSIRDCIMARALATIERERKPRHASIFDALLG